MPPHHTRTELHKQSAASSRSFLCNRQKDICADAHVVKSNENKLAASQIVTCTASHKSIVQGTAAELDHLESGQSRVLSYEFSRMLTSKTVSASAGTPLSVMSGIPYP